MARIRSIHPGMPSDEAFMSMSMAAKAAWPILWTECDDHGVFEWKPIVLKARIFPADNVDFAVLLAEYEHLGCVKQVVDELGKPFGLIRNFCKFQRPKHPSYRHPITAFILEYVGSKETVSGSDTPALPPPSPLPTEKPPLMKEEGDSREEDKEEKKGSRKAPRRISYPLRFLVFWGNYPSDPGMSKSEAMGEWQNHTREDQEIAIASIPAFKSWVAKQGSDYRIIHACRYLKKRRFDGFAAQAEKLAEAADAASMRVYVKYGTEAGDAWERHYRAAGKIPPRDQNGGWWFDTEFPETNVQRETSEIAA